MGGPKDTVRVPALPTLEDDLLRALRHQKEPVLIVMSGASLGRRVQLNDSITIGRGPNCHLRLSDTTVSVEHACIDRRDGHWVLLDAGSRN